MTQQLLTPYQSQYYGWLLTRHAASDTVESLAFLVDSQDDLNLHQVEAALFARKNAGAADRERDKELGFCWFRSPRVVVETKTGELT